VSTTRISYKPVRVRAARAGYGPTLAIAVTLAVGAFLALMSAVISVVHPQQAGLGQFVGLVNQQNQTAKSFLYVVAFVVILPLALVLASWLADTIAGGSNGQALSLLAALLAASQAAVLILVRLSHHLPWGDGLTVLLVGMVAWTTAACACLARARSAAPWRSLLSLRSLTRGVWITAGVLVFGVLLCVTARSSLHPLPLVIGVVGGVAVLVIGPRLRPPSLTRPWGPVVDVVFAALVALAVANVIVFHTSGRLPNVYVPPGVIQNQQDYLLGSANQLRGGGALLVNVPGSQYGVGLVYFLDGWFHLVPIGYGTLGLLDSILTAGFYVIAYCVLRIAGAGRLIAVAAIAAAVVALILGLRYPVGALPETGPLRFGLPLVLVLARTVHMRWPSVRAAAVLSFAVLGVSAVWAFEAFVYTAVTFAVIVAVQAWLGQPGERRRWLIRQVGLALAACVIAHLTLAVITLLVSGHLPDWGQYLTYLRSFLLGGEAGVISYGFSNWSPGLAVGGATLASAAALVLLVRRAPLIARREPVTLVALAGSTAYEVALLSYADNRSLTYLLPYITLPLLIAAALWLALLLRWCPEAPDLARRGGLAFALAVGTLVIATAWPSIGPNFSQSALAHAYPGGGLRAAVHRLVHSPPIDPRAPEGVRLLDRYVPGDTALIVLPVDADLGVEILTRGGRTNSMFIGDPVDDSLVPSLWMDKLTAAVARLRAGQRLLIDRGTLAVLAALRAHPGIDPEAHPMDGGDQELEWLLNEIARRFEIRPIHQARDGLIIAALARRG
jgi:hypothetical protein